MSLDDDPFEVEFTKAGVARISRGGWVVVTLGGARAADLRARLGRGADADQQLLARVTGNYRRGNERTARRR